MRVAINMPLKDGAGRLLDASGVAARATAVESAGLDGIWMGDAPSQARPDPLMWLLTAANATTKIEVGTSIYIVPMRDPYELAQRFATLQALTCGRFTVGVGAGSGRNGYELQRLDFEDRFARLYEHMRIVRSALDGNPPEIEFSPQATAAAHRRAGQRGSAPWGTLVGRPRFILGAWHSDVSLRRAVTEFDGWMCSASRTNFTTMRDAISRWRDLGGGRAMVSTCRTDLRATTKSQGDDDSYFLECSPEEARERLGRLVELGFDDILLAKTDHTNPLPLYEPDFTRDDLDEIRSLLPRDARPPAYAGAVGR